MADERDDAPMEGKGTPQTNPTAQSVEREDPSDTGTSEYLHTEAPHGPEQAAREPNNGPAHAPVGADDIEDKPNKDLYERLADKDVSPTEGGGDI